MKPYKQAALGFLAASALLAGAHQATAATTPLWPVGEPDVYTESIPSYHPADYKYQQRCTKTTCTWSVSILFTSNVSPLKGTHPKPEIRPFVYGHIGSDAYFTSARTVNRSPVMIVAKGRIYGTPSARWTATAKNVDQFSVKFFARGHYRR